MEYDETYINTYHFTVPKFGKVVGIHKKFTPDEGYHAIDFSKNNINLGSIMVNPQKCWVEALDVPTQFQRHSFGRIFYQFTERELLSHCYTISLESADDAIGFWKKQGFVTDIPSNETRMEIMRKNRRKK